jgi:hypothetical protein
MQYPTLEPGRAYRLTRQLEVRDEKSGSMKTYYLKGSVLHIKKVAKDEDRVWVEGCALPIPLSALRAMVQPEA